MIPLRASAASHAANASPSITMERGGYRMRAPYSKTPAQTLFPGRPTRSDGRMDRLRPSSHLALLVVLLAFASLSSFGMAYYLLSSRWDARELGQRQMSNRFQDVPVEHRQVDPPQDPDEKFFAYLPHSGFHNQRIAFENAIVLSRMMNRTLLMPPIYLGSTPIHYVPFDVLYQHLVLENKFGLYHCSRIALLFPLPLECTEYFNQTQISWNWLMDLDGIQQRQRLYERWNLTEAWLQINLNMSRTDILFIKDIVPYQYRFLDTRSNVSPVENKFSESVYILDLAMSTKRLIQVGTLFGSSRLRLKNPSGIAARGFVRESMNFANPLLLDAAMSIAHYLGPFYVGVHLRLGDGDFKDDGETHLRRAWWQIVHNVLAYNEEETLLLEHTFAEGIQDLPREASEWHIDGSFNELTCRGPLHTNPDHLKLNTPIFISTDVDEGNAVLSGFRRTFPCVFFLSDFPGETVQLDEQRNPLDGVSMKSVINPFLDALVVGHAWKVVGTKDSTFSTFVQDVLWRKCHGLRIVQRG